MVSIVLTQDQLNSIHQQEGGTPPVNPIPPDPPINPIPPDPPITPPADAVNLGEMYFSSVRVPLSAMGGHPSYVTIKIPAGFEGKRTTWDVYEYVDAQRARKIYFTKDVNARPDWPAYGEGSSASIPIFFGSGATNAVNVQAGETWYGVIHFERLDGSPSLNAGELCNFASTLYVAA